MSSDTFKSMLAKLIQKSRKAVRIYSAAGRDNFGRQARPFAELQIQVWSSVNEDLLLFLQDVTTRLHLRQVATELLHYMERLNAELQPDQAKLHAETSRLERYAAQQDFANCAQLAKDLMLLKAKIEARKAVIGELEEILVYANLRLPVTHQAKADPQEHLQVTEAKIIPFPNRKIGI